MKRTSMYLMILSVFLAFSAYFPAFAEGIEEGSPVENFTLPNGLKDEKIDFEKEIKGKSKLTALIFANTSCGACRKEMATLSELSKEYKDFATYVILVDMKGDEVIDTFSKRFDFNVTYLLDPEFSVPPAYGFYFTPSLLLIDSEGIIKYKKGGYNIAKDDEVVKSKIKALLK